jgi:hypothetical protein
MDILSIVSVAFVSAFITYLLFRKHSVFLWGFLAALMPDLPVFILALLGATNLHSISTINRTVGLFIWPALLIILDILLIELNLFGYFKPLFLILPKSVKTALRFEIIVEKLQNYNAIPRPIRLKRVYVVGFISILIYLVIIYILIFFGYPLFFQ